MKLDLGKRIMLFVHWVVSLLLAALMILMISGVGDGIRSALSSGVGLIVFIAFVILYLLLAAVVVHMLCKREASAERGFITVDSSETGKVRISVPAIEQMVKQAVRSVDGIADMKINVDSVDEAIDIQMSVTMVNGSHVPTVTLSMQRAIRRYVEMNSGVAVHAVSISIQAVTATADGMKRPKRSALKPALPAQSVTEEVPAQQPEVVEYEEYPVEVEETAEVIAHEAQTAEEAVGYTVSEEYAENAVVEESEAADEVSEEYVEETYDEVSEEEEYYSEDEIVVEEAEAVEGRIEEAVEVFETAEDEFEEEEIKN